MKNFSDFNIDDSHRSIVTDDADIYNIHAKNAVFIDNGPSESKHLKSRLVFRDDKEYFDVRYRQFDYDDKTHIAGAVFNRHSHIKFEYIDINDGPLLFNIGPFAMQYMDDKLAKFIIRPKNFEQGMAISEAQYIAVKQAYAEYGGFGDLLANVRCIEKNLWIRKANKGANNV